MPGLARTTAALALALAAAPAAAISIDLVDTHAVAARDLVFEGVRYDVTFDSRSLNATAAAYLNPFPFLGRSFAELTPIFETLNAALEQAGVTGLGDPAAGAAFLRGVIPMSEVNPLDPDSFIGFETFRFGSDWRIGAGVALDHDLAVGTRNRAFLVFQPTAVPAPAALALLIPALASLLVFRRLGRSG